jgi:hypothetical protein
MILPFVFYVTNGIIVIAREANFDNAFISQFKFPGNLSGPELTEPVLTAFSSLLHRHFYYEIIDRHYSSIPLRPNYTVLVLVREEPVSTHTPYYSDFAPFHSVMIHGHHPHETVLCLMVAGLTPPQLEFAPSTMTPKWRFLECPGDRLKEILSYSAQETRL